MENTTSKKSEQRGMTVPRYPVDIFADFQVDFAQKSFSFYANGNAATLNFNSLRDALGVFKLSVSHRPGATKYIEKLHTMLCAIDVTVYIQNYRYGVLGPKANSIFIRLLKLYTRLKQ